MVKPNTTFAPLPARAIADEILSSQDIRVLAAIALHDRFSKNGIGCTAGHGRLSAIVGCHLKSLSRSIRTLAERGYIGGRDNPLNPKARCYFVIYSDLDAAFSKTATGNSPVTDRGNNPVTSKPIWGNNLVPENGPMGNRLAENAQSKQEVSSYNILSEAYKISREAENISGEAAQGREKNGSVGAILAMLERGIKAGSLKDGSKWIGYLEDIVSSGNQNQADPNTARAMRLLETFGDELKGGRP